jgi:hypothetical protein
VPKAAKSRTRAVLVFIVLIVGLAAVGVGALWVYRDHSVSVSPAAPATLEPVAGATPPAPGSTGVGHEFKLYPKIAVLGDTIALGSIDGGSSWVEQLASHMCWSVSTKSAEFQTGYTNPGGSPNSSAFTDRADDVAASAPAVVVVEGGVHDYRATAERLHDAALKTFTTLKDQSAPGTMIVAVGPIAAGEIVKPEDVARVSGSIASAAADAGVVWIDPMAEQWLPNGDFFSPDGILPNASGQAEYANRLAADLRAIGAPTGC